MIVPGRTTMPSERLTPRRLELLSRPFLELPTPFLCAMSLLRLFLLPARALRRRVRRRRFVRLRGDRGRLCRRSRFGFHRRLGLGSAAPALRRLWRGGRLGDRRRLLWLRLLSRRQDVLDDEPRVVLTVARLLARARLCLVAEDEDLARTALLGHRRQHPGALDERRADRHVVA